MRPRWSLLVLVFPCVSVGASGSNEIGGKYQFPGTYTVRPSTLRAIYMDLATELGEQGFRWIMVVHVHGSPLHIGALDDAGDFFHDTYGGQMVNLWGLMPVLGGWGSAMSVMTAEQKRDDGLSLHGGNQDNGGHSERCRSVHHSTLPVVPCEESALSAVDSVLQRAGLHTWRATADLACGTRAVPLIIGHDNARMTTDVTPRPTVAGLN